MNAERLLEVYEQISEAPDAIARLRRFVLDLAVRGKLVAQDAKDEPASLQCSRIAAAKAELALKHRKAKQKLVDPSLTEISFALPAGWAEARLSDLVRVVNGRAYKKPELLSEGTPVLRVGNLFTSDHWYYSDLELEDDKYCDKGDLIYAWSASFGPFIWEGPRVIYHYHIWKLPLFSEDDLSKRYIFVYLQQKTRGIKDAGHGISMIHMTKEKIEQLAVPLPPLPEQHRIVAKVDELMKLCDRLEEARKTREEVRNKLTAASLTRLTAPETTAQAEPAKVGTGFASGSANSEDDFPAHAAFALEALPALTTRPDQIETLRQTVLNLAVRGKLVKQDPADEPASELLETITETRKQLLKSKELKKSQPAKNPISFRDEYALPKGWTFANCDEMFFVTKLAGFEYTKYFNLQDKGEVPVIRAQNVRPMKISDENLKFISEAVSDALPRSSLTKDCLLITFIGAGIGDVALFEPKRKWHLAPNVAKAEPFQGSERLYNLRFLALFFNSPLGRREVFKHVKTTAQPSLSMGTIRDIDILLPPLAEQHRIVAKVDALMALCDRLEAALTTADTTRTRLLEALLQEALEPASKVLEAAE